MKIGLTQKGESLPKADLSECEPHNLALRFRKQNMLKPVQIHGECRDCDGRCCVNATPVFYRWERTVERRKGLQPILLSVSTAHVSKRFRYYVPEGYIEEMETAINTPEPLSSTMIGAVTGYGYRRSRVRFLVKTVFGRCVYLHPKTGRCGIYSRRPESCKRWYCDRGVGFCSTYDMLGPVRKTCDEKMPKGESKDHQQDPSRQETWDHGRSYIPGVALAGDKAESARRACVGHG